MKLLFIDACLRGKEISRTYKIAREFIEKLKSENDTVEEETFYLGELKIAPLSGEDVRKRDIALGHKDFNAPQFDFADRVARAEYIVIAAPYWDSSFPSVLRVFLEHTAANGITFCFDEDGRYKGLCKGKKLTYITTCGGYLAGNNLGYEYIKQLFSNYGIKDTEEYVLEGLDVVGNNIEVCLDNCKLIK